MNLHLLVRALYRERTETEKMAGWDAELYALEQKISGVLRQTVANRGTSYRVELVPVDTERMTEIVSFAEAARLLNVDRSTIYRRRRKGLLPEVEQAGRVGIPLSALEPK